MATYYVDGVSGSDGAAGTSFGTAFLTIGKAASSYAAGDTILICATGTYTITSTVTWSTAGTVSAPVIISGANATGTVDGTTPTITSATNSVIKFTLSAVSFLSLRYLKFTDTAATRGNGISFSTSGGNHSIFRCRIDGCQVGLNWAAGVANVSVTDTTIVNCKSHGVSASSSTQHFTGCLIYANLGSGITSGGGGSSTTLRIKSCVISGNSARGLLLSNNTSGISSTVYLDDSTISANGTDGIYFSTATGSGGDLILGQNNVIYGNGAYGIATQAFANDRNNVEAALFTNNFLGGNTSGSYSNILAGLADVTLSADPHTASGSGDFTLNTTAGGGALVRAAGFPGTFPGSALTGYRDGGALQHQDSGGGGPTYSSY